MRGGIVFPSSLSSVKNFVNYKFECRFDRGTAIRGRTEKVEVCKMSDYLTPKTSSPVVSSPLGRSDSAQSDPKIPHSSRN
jgi:hypothetical protein